MKLRADPLCQDCLEYDQRSVPATDVDHVHEIKDGGAVFDFANLRSLCKAHHNRKTKGLPIAGCDADGVPRDPRRRW